jgi:hypothetical protein
MSIEETLTYLINYSTSLNAIKELKQDKKIANCSYR